MEVEELRIGNYVYHKGDIVTVVWNDFEDCSYLEPILLTDELLLKIGSEIVDDFYNDIDKLFILTNGHVVSKIEGVYSIGYGYQDFNRELKGLHDLQNICYALDNEELEINL